MARHREGKKRSGCGGCLLKIFIAIVVIAILLVVAAVVIVNLTPDQLGIADIDINGTTLREMGLADTKIKEIIRFATDVMNANSSDIVTNPYNAQTEQSTADNNLSASVSVTPGEGGYNYTDILTDKVLYDGNYLYEYRDTTLAYLFQQMLDEANSGNADISNDALDFLNRINGRVEEVSINAAGLGYELRLVVSIDLGSYKTAIESRLPFRIVRIPDRVYIVSYSDITANSEGELVPAGRSIRINDIESVVADAIFTVISADAAENVEGGEELTGQEAVNRAIGDGFAAVIANLGRVGTADCDEQTRIVTGNVILGASGISSHALTVITYTADDVADTAVSGSEAA